MAAQALLYGGMAGLQLAGGYFASQNIKETARLNRDIANMNAEFAELDAYDALIEGESVKARSQAEVDAILGQQQARLTAADVDVTYGSASTIAEESRFIADLNKMEIENRYRNQALGLKQQARQYRFGGEMELARGEQRASDVMFGSVLGAGQAGLTGYQRSR